MIPNKANKKPNSTQMHFHHFIPSNFQVRILYHLCGFINWDGFKTHETHPQIKLDPDPNLSLISGPLCL